MYYVLVPLAVYGLILLRRRRVPVCPLVSTFALVALVAVLIYGDVRFREPAEISLVILAAVAVDRLWRRLRGEEDGVGRPMPAHTASSTADSIAPLLRSWLICQTFRPLSTSRCSNCVAAPSAGS
jgi:hypothetical protein